MSSYNLVSPRPFAICFHSYFLSPYWVTITKAVLVAHTKASAYSSSSSTRSAQECFHLFISHQSFFHRAFSLIKKINSTFFHQRSFPLLSVFFYPSSFHWKRGERKKREEKFKAVIFPTTVSAVPLFALFTSALKKRAGREKKGPVNDRPGEMEERRTRGRARLPHSHPHLIYLNF